MAATSLTPSKPLSHYHHDPTTPRPTMHMPHACEPLLAGWIASASIQQCMPGMTQQCQQRPMPTPIPVPTMMDTDDDTTPAPALTTTDNAAPTLPTLTPHHNCPPPSLQMRDGGD